MKNNLTSSTVIGMTLTAMAMGAATPSAHAATAGYTTADPWSRIRHGISGGQPAPVEDATDSGNASMFRLRHLPSAPNRCFALKNQGMSRVSCSQPYRDRNSGEEDSHSELTLGGGETYEFTSTAEPGGNDPAPRNNFPSSSGNTRLPGKEGPSPIQGGIQPAPEPSYILVTGSALLVLAGIARRRKQTAVRV